MAAAVLRNSLVVSVLVTLFSFAPLPPGDDVDASGGVVTLWATDDVRAAFSFENGNYAVDVIDGQAVLDRAQIAFSLFEKDKLSVGFVREQGQRVVNLGNVNIQGYNVPADRAVHPPLSIFHTLFVQGSNLYYRGPLGKTYKYSGVDSLFFTLPPDGVSSFEAKVGDTYVMRFAPQRAQSTQQRFVKFRVVDFEPGRWMTLRWARMTPLH